MDLSNKKGGYIAAYIRKVSKMGKFKIEGNKIYNGLQHSKHVFEIVPKIPHGFYIWNIGENMRIAETPGRASAAGWSPGSDDGRPERERT